ncbi:GxxExxY protein [Hymenobacter luteus]|uniref:GxxExxY protein n=2 Tax=Hymenobacter TaxID=89966 RepID=A0A7W9WA41_9BACT|nr:MULTISPECIES: GxxExxY protein [Hymenobacter]MBB4601449.1 GxxExxY protein [Hymenobacter latericoloratus]MBB6058344.1 GxxExxY protein [Hymenobacter luteus]
MSEQTNFYKHTDLTKQIIGCAMRVHSILGSGFQEVIYQRALAVEMTKQQLLFAREVEMPIYYEQEHIGTRRVDFLVAGCILVELKAVSQLEKVHLAQGLNYLEAFYLDVGLLLNFGSPSLEFRRLVKSTPRR